MTYIWPTKLFVPARPPKLVYLDLNYWVSLSKAQAGHTGGDEFKEVLDACDAAATRGAAMFPISDSIYFECPRLVDIGSGATFVRSSSACRASRW